MFTLGHRGVWGLGAPRGCPGCSQHLAEPSAGCDNQGIPWVLPCSMIHVQGDPLGLDGARHQAGLSHVTSGCRLSPAVG